ncbi:major facilitator superfamily transporter [Mycena sp. CBHHK59/15]|nr:major facilitator superfamily transporter [Mycena sp. CBHHK59/15]KAJ6624227.1 major facilitator superfamily transporter [Mycena sp. CBHHK59/15]
MAGGGAVADSGVPLKEIFRRGLFPREYFVAFSLVTTLFFLWGFCYGLLDVLNKHFQSVLDITKLQSTGLQVAYFGIGYFAYSPVAGEVLRRFGYKPTILMGLSLYSLGAILFWPCAHFAATSDKHAIFGGFVVCTAVTACGLATLEVAANSYISVMPPIEVAAFRLNFSQSFNGVASFAGPFIASKYFFTGENSKNLTNVQYVYIAVAGMGVMVALAFIVTRLPEVSEEELQAAAAALAEESNGDAKSNDPFYKQYRAIFGFVAQFMYVGAQVTIGSFFLNYVTESAGRTTADASNLLSYSLIIFTVMRFVMTAVLSFVAAPVVLFVNAIIGTVLVILVSTLPGTPGMICLMLIYATMSCQYPVIFVLGTSGLGRHTRRAASLLVMGVAGGAVFPPVQGAIADNYSTRVSYGVSAPAFAFVAFFAAYVWVSGDRQIILKKTDHKFGADAETVSALPDKSSGDVQIDDAGFYDKA